MTSSCHTVNYELIRLIVSCLVGGFSSGLEPRLGHAAAKTKANNENLARTNASNDTVIV